MSEWPENADDWIVRGYDDGVAGRCAPPNEPVAARAYEHGRQNALDDRRGEPRAPAAWLRQIANGIRAMPETPDDR